MSSVRRKVSTGKFGGRSTSEGVDRLVLTASLRVDKPKVNITFPEKPAVNEVTDKVKDILVVGVPPEGKSAADTKISSPEVERETKVAAAEDVPAENVQAANIPAADIPVEDAQAADIPVEDAQAADVPVEDAQVADTPAKDTQVENIDDRNILTSEPSVVKTDGLIDEDMLRDMISDIVREELQGDLGEKITRNVRRLVRREIHRTMVSTQLE